MLHAKPQTTTEAETPACQPPSRITKRLIPIPTPARTAAPTAAAAHPVRDSRTHGKACINCVTTTKKKFVAISV